MEPESTGVKTEMAALEPERAAIDVVALYRCDLFGGLSPKK